MGGGAPAGGGCVGPGGGWTGTALQHMDELRFGWGGNGVPVVERYPGSCRVCLYG